MSSLVSRLSRPIPPPCLDLTVRLAMSRKPASPLNCCDLLFHLLSPFSFSLSFSPAFFLFLLFSLPVPLFLEKIKQYVETVAINNFGAKTRGGGFDPMSMLQNLQGMMGPGGPMSGMLGGGGGGGGGGMPQIPGMPPMTPQMMQQMQQMMSGMGM